MPVTIVPDFNAVTETPQTRATSDQLRIMYTRYYLAVARADSRDVLEVACGAGMGLGLLANVARRTVGIDIDERNYMIARQTYSKRTDIEVQQCDAQNLPFSDASFDLVILYEALYYLRSPDSFFQEARRVLRPGGTLLISTVNCRWYGFNRSPFSARYFDATELADVLDRHGFRVELRGGFPESTHGPRHTLIGFFRRAAIRFHLIPKTMKSKEWLKRLFYGKLEPIPTELVPGMSTPFPLDVLSPPYSSDQYRFIYAIATLS